MRALRTLFKNSTTYYASVGPQAVSSGKRTLKRDSFTDKSHIDFEKASNVPSSLKQGRLQLVAVLAGKVVSYAFLTSLVQWKNKILRNIRQTEV